MNIAIYLSTLLRLPEKTLTNKLQMIFEDLLYIVYGM